MTTNNPLGRLSGVASFTTAVEGEYVRAILGIGPMFGVGEVRAIFGMTEGCSVVTGGKNQHCSVEVLISMDSVRAVSDALKDFRLMASTKSSFVNGSVQRCETPSDALLTALEHHRHFVL